MKQSHNEKTDAQWQEVLSAEQYRVLRGKGTEAPFTGALLNNHQEGHYRCAGCQQVLFEAGDKFDSGTGWPSFTAPAQTTCVVQHVDGSHGMRRVEVVCSGCSGHLGHVFADGPAPGGQRYCINSASLTFAPHDKP